MLVTHSSQLGNLPVNLTRKVASDSPSAPAGSMCGTGKFPVTALTGRPGPFKLPHTLKIRSRMLPEEHCTGKILAAEYILSPTRGS
jgi:hypothetical protein